MKKRQLVAAGVVLAAPRLALAQQDMEPWRMHEWGWGGMWLGPLFMLVLLGLVVALFFWFVRWVSSDRGIARSEQPTAREILDARYAGGEIGRDEYLKRRQDIASG